jgi:hypothetical protein
MPADLSNYTLAGGPNLPNPATAASLGIPDIAFAFKSRSIDTARFSIPVQAADADPIIPFGSPISICQAGVQIFLGTLQTAPEAVIEGEREAQSFTLEGPWWWLEHTVFQQSWTVKNSDGTMASEPRSHLVLFQDIAGNRITTGAQIIEALNWAIGAGAPFRIGNILAGVAAPTRDASDMTCAEVIKSALRWTPDAVSRIDYSTNPPTLHIQPRSALAAVALPMVSDIAASLHITGRHDLQVPSVTLKYEQTNTDDTNSWTTTSVDTYPAGSNEQAAKAIVQTLQLSGSHATRQKQSIITSSLPARSDTAAIIEWFKTKNPWLSFISSDYFAMVVGSYSPVMDPKGQLAADGVTELPDTWTEADLPNELVSGTIAPWMEKAYPNLQTGQLTLGVTLRFIGLLSNYTPQQQAMITSAFNIGSGDANDNYLWFYTSVMATNATTQVYSVVSSSEAAEGVPVGLAEALYDALGTLYYDGGFSTTEADISRAVNLGNTLNLIGGRAEWGAMAAVVQEVNWSLASGKTTIKFGPPEHLSPQDMVEFLRGLRATKQSDLRFERSTGEASGSVTVDGAGKSPRTVIQSPPGGGGSPAPWHPYQINDETGTTGGPQVSVDGNSDLWATFDTNQAISGLDTPFGVAVGDLIWLNIGIDSATNVVPDNATIAHGAAWNGHSNPIILDTSDPSNPYQTDYNKIIAEVVATTDPREGKVIGPAGNQVKIIQHLKSSLICTIWVYSGAAVCIPEEMAV